MAKRYSKEFLIGEGAEAKRVTIPGRFGWCLEKLIAAGDKGVTAFDEIGPRLSHYIFGLRRFHGLTIETRDERHGGQFSGTHGRYVLKTKARVVADDAAPLATLLSEALERSTSIGGAP